MNMDQDKMLSLTEGDYMRLLLRHENTRHAWLVPGVRLDIH
jgi:hypothetical protein